MNKSTTIEELLASDGPWPRSSKFQWWISPIPRRERRGTCESDLVPGESRFPVSFTLLLPASGMPALTSPTFHIGPFD